MSINQVDTIKKLSAQSGPSFVYHEDLAKIEAELKGHILRVTDFSTHFDAVDKPYIYSQLAIPALCDLPHEVWTSSSRDKVTYHHSNKLEYSKAGKTTLIRVVVDENDTKKLKQGHRTALAQAGYEAYTILFDFMKKHNYGELVRVWNYVPQLLMMSDAKINREDRERYRQFNTGRSDAWHNKGPRDKDGNLLRPSATGVGTHNGPLVIEAVASKNPVFYIDNPRQIPAYNYPTKYGTKSPAFSRATLHMAETGPELYIAGTASIVGSETVHIGDVKKQVDETFKNIEALISTSNLSPYIKKGFELQDIMGVRVYIKNPDDYELVRKCVEKYLGSEKPITYLNNDICRPDLLLEIEGIARKTSPLL